MINVPNTNMITAVEFGGDPRMTFYLGGISDELHEIVSLLIENLKGFTAWVQLYALLPHPVLETAASELNRISELLINCYLKLTNYHQQLPQPKDSAIAIELEKLMTSHQAIDVVSLDAILAVDHEAREKARK